MFERFAADARDAVSRAQDIARRRGDARITSAHVLLALAAEPGTVAADALAALDVSADELRPAVDRALATGPRTADRHGAGPQETDRDEVDEHDAGEHDVDEHDVDSRTLGVRETDPDALDADALAGIGIDLAAVRRQVEETFGSGALDRPAPTGRRRRLGFSVDAKRLLEQSLRTAVAAHDRRLDAGHLLVAAAQLDGSPAQRALASVGVTVPRAASAVDHARADRAA